MNFYMKNYLFIFQLKVQLSSLTVLEVLVVLFVVHNKRKIMFYIIMNYDIRVILFRILYILLVMMTVVYYMRAHVDPSVLIYVYGFSLR